jgi:hypothetical protein
MKMRKTKWYLLYIVLAVLVLFSVFAVPKIAVHTLEKTRGQIFTVSDDTN